MKTNLPLDIRSEDDVYAVLNATRFWRTQDWIDRWGKCDHGDDWIKLSKEGKQAFIKASVEDGHKREYYQALLWTNFNDLKDPIPLWENLREEQRVNIRTTNDAYAESMREFGNGLQQENNQ